MSTVNFNDTVPAPPANFTNLKWQSDASGNISAYDPGGTWTNWTPTVTPGAGMTASGVSFTHAYYIRSGPIINFSLRVLVTFGGTAATYCNFSLPVPAYDSENHPVSGYTLGPQFGASVAVVVGGTVNSYPNPAGSSATLGSQYTLAIAGSYRCS